MDRREPPQTEEGWYALHDLRRVDWDAWREAPERERTMAIEEGVDYLQSHVALEDAEAGGTAVYTILGHKADLLIIHLRPTMAHLDTAERRFEGTALAGFTEQVSSYVSVTEASGYTERAKEYFDGEVDDDSGLAQYIQSRLHPEIPDSEHVSFYPMSKRRDPEQNWYSLPFDERAEHMASHGDIGRGYAGKVQQMITGSVGFDDHEWGVTLWADDPTDVKDLLYEMRFDPSTAEFAEFGTFYFGRRIEPTDLDAVLAGEPVQTDAVGGESRDAAAATGQHAEAAGGDAGPAGGDADSHGRAHAGSASEGDHPHGEGGASDEETADDHPDTEGGGRPDPGDAELSELDDLAERLAGFSLYPGDDYPAGSYGLLFRSDADAQDLADEVDGLRSNFDHYDTHVLTSVRASGGQAAIISIWANQRAADTAAGFLSDLDGVTEQYGGPLGDAEDGDDEEESAEDGETHGTDADDDIRGELADQNIYAGKPHGEDVYAMVLYSEADVETVTGAVDDLRGNFEHYDTHVKTAVYRDTEALRVVSTDEDRRGDGDLVAIVSLWETKSAADTAGGFLSDLPGIVGRAGEGDGFGTMGMFYTVKPDYREEFVETFGEVGGLLDEMDGHHDTALLVNEADENDMFISSQWAAREDAMAFFRSDAFRDTVEWGREVLDDRPRHVFLA